MSVTVQQALLTGARWLSDAGVPNADRDVRVLLAHAIGCEPSRLILMEDEEVLPDVFRRYDSLLAAREKFQPVSQIIGGREFWGRWFEVTRDVLDPRPETETLIDIALKLPSPVRALDLGTGSGILAVTLAAEVADLRVIAVDISQAALDVAARNAVANGVDARVEFRLSNWFDAVEGKFDLVVSNPPYIAMSEIPGLSPDVLNWEPLMALTPGGDGLDAYRFTAQKLDTHLDTDGTALFEIGYRQAEMVSAIFRSTGFNDISISSDMNGHDRIVTVKR